MAALTAEAQRRGETRQGWDTARELQGLKLDGGYRVDMSVWRPVHEAQLLTYLRLGGWKIGLLVNFNVPVLRIAI